jgi:hypothetical protein
MTNRIRYCFSLTLAIALLLAGCAQFIESASGLLKLRAALVKEYGEEGVAVNLTDDRILTITFINSQLNTDAKQRALRAKQTALFVTKHYSEVRSVTEIWIVFASQKTEYVVMTRSQILATFGFDRNAQALTNSNVKQAFTENTYPELEPLVTYNDKANATNISLNRVQLAGDTTDGLMLAPHFTVTGDAQHGRLAAQPEVVGFDFAYYSRVDQFPGETPIEMLANDKKVFRSKGVFTGSRSPDGIYSKYLYMKLSYQQFQQLIAHENVTIVLGTEKYPLSKEQLDALRRLTGYVKS